MQRLIVEAGPMGYSTSLFHTFLTANLSLDEQYRTFNMGVGAKLLS